MHASMYQINFQRPKRNVSVGALDEIKPDLEGLAQRYQLLGFDPIKVRLQARIETFLHVVLGGAQPCCTAYYPYEFFPR